MTYVEIMIQAYTLSNNITREEAIKRLGISNLVPTNKMRTEQISEPRRKEILNDLRKDQKGVLAWGLK